MPNKSESGPDAMKQGLALNKPAAVLLAVLTIILLPRVSFAGKSSGLDAVDVSDIINRAGRQRMLIQRMTKNYLLIHLKMFQLPR